MRTTTSPFTAGLERLLPDLETLYTDVHAHPELSIMDALPVEEATGLPYASTASATDRTGSTVPVMHACGHDMHVAWLVGATTLLAESRGEWRGTLVAIFQPGVETMVVAARAWLAA